MTGARLDLSIIIVNWNVRQLLADCLASLQSGVRLDPRRWEVIVVDNDSHDGSVEMLRARFAHVRLIEAGDNLGFAGGCEAGYAASRGDLILLLNPDTVVPPGAVDALMETLHDRPDAGIVGSRLVNSDGSFQRAAGGAFPSLSNMMWNYLFLNRVLPRRLAPPPVFMEDDVAGVSPIDWVSGAALMIRREAAGGKLFDEAFFMYGEDMDLCARAWRAGWVVLYSGRQSITHHQGRSFRRQTSVEVLSNIYKGPRLFFARRRGRLSVAAYDAILLVGFLTRWMIHRARAALTGDAVHRELAHFSAQYLGIMLRAARRGQARIAPAARGEAPGAGAPLRFSVIMNAYNGAPWLNEAIDSVLAQSFTNWELVIWDDCSSDGTAAICAAYTDPRVRYVRSPDQVPLPEARNAAIALARGEWLAFLDQDDVWTRTKLADQAALIDLDAGGALTLVYGRTVRFNARGRRGHFDPWHGPGRLPQGDVFGELLRKPSFIALSSAVLRADVTRAVGPVPPDVVYCPDYYLFLQVSRRGRAACVQETCCLYREHGTNMSVVFRKQINEEAIRIIEQAAGGSRRADVRRRRRVHQTWVGLAELREPGLWRAGLRRILGQGSLAYLLGRPLILASRGLRDLWWRPA